jgi:septal ring factor EnvC (AmiA/AmiB activator)
MSLLVALLALAPSIALPWAKPMTDLEAENKRLKEELAEATKKLLDSAIENERVRSERDEWRTRHELNSIPPRPQELHHAMYAQMYQQMQCAQNSMNQMNPQQAQAMQNAYQQGIAQAPDWIEHFCNCTPSRSHGLLGVVPGG